MNIALIGAPGSGKSALAADLAKELGQKDPDCDCVRTVAIVDDYCPEIEIETNIALGPIADYLGNLYVALGRYGRERVARMDHQIVISAGTIIETAVYTAMHFVGLTAVLNEEQQQEAAPRIDATLRILACLYADICQYDYAFYLPPTMTPADEDWAYFDQQLQAALEGFKLLPVTPLTNSSNQVSDALSALEKVPHEVHAA